MRRIKNGFITLFCITFSFSGTPGAFADTPAGAAMGEEALKPVIEAKETAEETPLREQASIEKADASVPEEFAKDEAQILTFGTAVDADMKDMGITFEEDATVLRVTTVEHEMVIEGEKQVQDVDEQVMYTLYDTAVVAAETPEEVAELREKHRKDKEIMRGEHQMRMKTLIEEHKIEMQNRIAEIKALHAEGKPEEGIPDELKAGVGGVGRGLQETTSGGKEIALSKQNIQDNTMIEDVIRTMEDIKPGHEEKRADHEEKIAEKKAELERKHAEHEAEMAARKEEHDLKMEEHRKLIAERKAEQEAALADHEAEIAARKAAHEKEMAERKAELEKKQAEHEAEMAAKEAENNRKIEEMRAEQERKIAEKKAAHEAERAAHEAEIDAKKAAHDQEKEERKALGRENAAGSEAQIQSLKKENEAHLDEVYAIVKATKENGQKLGRSLLGELRVVHEKHKEGMGLIRENLKARLAEAREEEPAQREITIAALVQEAKTERAELTKDIKTLGMEIRSTFRQSISEMIETSSRRIGSNLVTMRENRRKIKELRKDLA